MDTRKFLQEMLSEGKSLLNRASGYADKGAEYAAEKLGAEKGSADHDRYKTIAKGAAGVGALALALGTSGGGALARIGGLAALGAMAYGAYRRSQGEPGVFTDEAPSATIDASEGPEADRRARTLLQAMIMAARADGEIDPAERAMLDEKLATLGGEAQSFFLEELMKPIDPAALGRAVESPQEAREVYAAAALVCAHRSSKEQDFLWALADALKLPPAVRAAIDADVAKA